MSYIKIQYGGQKTNGGYLTIDGVNHGSLKNGELIKVDAGFHTLNFSSSLYNDYYTKNIKGVITEDLKENEMLTLTVMSGSNGEILDLPAYKISNVTDKEVVDLENSYVDQFSNELTDDLSSYKTELLLCIFLGWLGVHKFYKGKIIMGLLYMFSLGLLGIGWLIDIIVLIVKIVKIKKLKKKIS